MEAPYPRPDPSNDFLADHARLLRASYRTLTGRDLIDPSLTDRDAAQALYEAPFALLSHSADTEPILTYGNAQALALFELTWEALTRLPSRYTAEAPDRAKRQRLLQAVQTRGYIDDYAGVRVSATGRRFRIEGACVWNLIDRTGRHLGQAACFQHWRELD
jgi:hypothetical protein